MHSTFRFLAAAAAVSVLSGFASSPAAAQADKQGSAQAPKPAAQPNKQAGTQAPKPPGQPGTQAKAAAPGGQAEMEKTLVANERAVQQAVAKGDKATFAQHVAEDGWSIDSSMGPMAISEFLKGFDEMTKAMKITSWDISDVKTYWANPGTAVLMYKWTGQGTYQGQPIPSTVWCSTVWTRRNAKWIAVFHQESLAGTQK